MAGISQVFTIGRVAEMLGEDEDLLQEISFDMDPKDTASPSSARGDNGLHAQWRGQSHRTRQDGQSQS
jgi:hypothetical protein